MRYQLAGTILVAASLAACNTASPGFMGADVQTVTVDGSTFDVRRKGDRVELIRTNREAVFSLRSIVPLAAEAVVAATGCAPKDGTWTGDQAVMRVRVDCP
jgi:predicted small secreted protein